MQPHTQDNLDFLVYTGFTVIALHCHMHMNVCTHAFTDTRSGNSKAKISSPLCVTGIGISTQVPIVLVQYSARSSVNCIVLYDM